MPQNRVTFVLQFLIFLSCSVAAAHAQVEFREAEHEPLPWQTVNRQSYENMVTIGLSVAGSFWPPASGVKKAYDGLELFRKSADYAVEQRIGLGENDLLLIDRDAQRLDELRSQGRNWWNDSEALETRDRLLKRSQQDDGWLIFAGKALGSPSALYAAVKYTATKGIGKYIGTKVAKWLGVGDSTRLAFLGEGRVRNQLTRTQWKKLKRVAEFGEKFTDELTKAFLAKMTEKFVLETLRRKIDERVEKILRDLPPLPSGGGGGRRLTGVDLRLYAVQRPQLYMPVLLPSVRMAELAPRRLEMQPIRLQTYRDPVVNTAAVNSQAIGSTYQIDSAATTVRSESSEPSHWRSGGIDIRSDISKYRNPNFDGSRFR